MVLGTCELLWLKILLYELGFMYNGHMTSRSYSNSTRLIARNSPHERTNYFEIDVHLLEKRLKEKITEYNVHESDQLADLLTKYVSRRMLSQSLSKLGIVDIYAPDGGRLRM